MSPVHRSLPPVLLALMFAGTVQISSASTDPARRDCVSMSVTVAPLAGQTDTSKQHYRISFHNRCEKLRVVYWCAEHPSRPLAAAPVCAKVSVRQSVIASPLYAIDRQREFQWVLPEGTRIRYVDCNESRLPTSDLGCNDPAQRQR